MEVFMGNYKNLVGAKFGKLTVVEDAGRYSTGNVKWKCQCECGAIRFSKGSYLEKGEIKSCKECVHENLCGKQCGKIFVLERAPDKIVKNQKVIMWKCKCECGEIIYRRSHNLIHKDCSCLKCKKKIDRNRNYKGCKDISGTYWSSLKHSAELRGIKFDVDIEHAWKLYEDQNKQCAISGIEIGFANTRKEYLSQITTASLDRIDSSLDYIDGNIQWTHKTINKMKSNQLQNDFIQLCFAICDYQRNKNNEA